MNVDYKRFPEQITADEERDLLDKIEKLPWLDDLSRQVQHYGWKYDYKTRRVVKLDDPIPDFLLELKSKFYPSADQIIINKYLPGQGISRHRDASVFHDLIMTLSLGSGAMFNVENEEIYLNPRDLFVMKKPVYHELKQRRSDVLDGVVIPRTTRISVTFRRVR